MDASGPGTGQGSFFLQCVEVLGDPVLGLSAEGSVRCLNEAATEMPTRYGNGHRTPEAWWEAMLRQPPPEGLEAWIREVVARGRPDRRKHVRVSDPGRRVEMTWDVTAFPAGTGPDFPGVLLVVRDGTPDLVLLDSLRRERDFSRRLLQAAGALVVVLDRSARIVQFNRVCEEVTGYREEEVRGQSLPDLLLTPEERAGVLEVIADLGHGNFPNQHENDWVTRTGERRRIRWTNTVVQGPDGEVLYVVGTGFDVTEQRRREAELRHRVVHDPLTGLANRVLLEELLRLAFHRAERNPTYFYGVMFLDLDGFKDINDRWGHPFGDLVLKAVADRLRRGVRRTDTVVRYGGDEFVVLLEPVSGEGDLPMLADRVLRVLREPMEIEGVSLVLTASIGVVMGGRGESSPGDLLARADRAMYQSKRSGKSRSSFLPRPSTSPNQAQ